MSKDRELSQGFASEDGITFLAPALLSYVLQTSLLVMFGTRKPFHRAAGTMILQSCQSVSMHRDLHRGESPSPLPTGATDLVGNGILQTLVKKVIVPSGLLELLELTWAQLIQLPGPHAALSIISAWGMAGDRVPWAAARDMFSGRRVFAGLQIRWPTASCESKAPWRLFAVVEGCPRTAC